MDNAPDDRGIRDYFCEDTSTRPLGEFVQLNRSAELMLFIFTIWGLTWITLTRIRSVKSYILGAPFRLTADRNREMS